MSDHAEQGLAFNIVRDQQRSNSVFVVQPSATEGLTAVATCEATLEAIPQSLSCNPLLEAALPLYPESEPVKRPGSDEARSKQSVFTDIPISSQEFNQTWTSLCAFEVEGQAYRPAPGMLWMVWKSLLSACTIKGCSLDQPLNLDFLAGAVEDDEIPIPLLDAVMNRVSTDEGVIEPRYARIDVTKCVQWTGAVLLQSDSTDSNHLAVSEFLTIWKDQLPESWRRHDCFQRKRGDS
ncbi:MAG: hypothetical protein Q9184_003692 [Pyrenodesmia sp. 2 TL-2023]